MSFMIDRFAPFQFSAFATSDAPLSEKEAFVAKGRDLALANRLPPMQRLQLALLRMLPADRSQIAIARRKERQLLPENKRLIELSSRIFSDMGYRCGSSGDCVPDVTAMDKQHAAAKPPALKPFPAGGCPAGGLKGSINRKYGLQVGLEFCSFEERSKA